MADRIGFMGMIGDESSGETGRYGKFIDGLVGLSDDPYPELRGRAVEISTANGQEYGIYNGLNNRGNIVLEPFVDRETIPANPNLSSDERRQVYFWNGLGPCFISEQGVVKIKPVSRDHLDEIVRQSNLAGDEIQGELFDSEAI